MSDATLTVAVQGAGGVQGGRLVVGLRAAGHAVRPLDSRSADLASVDALTAGFTGADAVVVQLPQVHDERAYAYAANTLAALAKAGTGRVVFNTAVLLTPGPIGAPFVDARLAFIDGLAALAAVATVVVPVGPYLENVAQPWSVRQVRDHGEIRHPMPAPVPIPWCAFDDVADVIGGALVDPAPPARLAVLGPDLVTGDQVAAAVGAAAGREVRWVSVDPAEYGRLIAPVVGAEAGEGVGRLWAAALAAPPLAPPPADSIRAGTRTVHSWAEAQDWTGGGGET